MTLKDSIFLTLFFLEIRSIALNDVILQNNVYVKIVSYHET